MTNPPPIAIRRVSPNDFRLELDGMDSGSLPSPTGQLPQDQAELMLNSRGINFTQRLDWIERPDPPDTLWTPVSWRADRHTC